MRIVWQGLALVAVIAVAAIAVILIHPPASIVNSYAEQFGRETLGRRIEVGGRTSLSLVPTPKVRMEDVTILNPPGTPGRAMLQAAAVEIDASVGFWSITPTAVRIMAPTLQLVRDASGKGNWTGLGGAQGSGEAVALGDITVTGGTLIYTEATSGEIVRLQPVGMRVLQPTAEAPLDVTFDTEIEKERVTGKARLAPFKALMQGKPTPATVTLSASPGRAELDGTFNFEAPSWSGKARLDAPSLEKLTAWLGIDPQTLGSGALAFKGDVAVGAEASSIKPASAPATESASSPVLAPQPGAIIASVSNADLTVTGTGDRKRLSLEKLQATTAFVSTSQPIEAIADMTWNGARVDMQARVQSIEALLNRSKSAVFARFGSPRGRLEINGDVLPGQAASFIGKAKGSTGSLRALAESAGFAAPLDAGLEAAEFEGDVSATAGSLKLWNARLRVDETTARGSLTVETSGPRPVIGGKLTVDKVDTALYLPRRAAVAQPASPRHGGGTQEPADEPAKSDSSVHNPFAVIEFVPLAETLRSEIARLEGKSAVTTEAPVAAAAPGWSEAPLDLSGLKAADLDLDLTIGEVKVGQRAIAVPQLKTVLKDGRLVMDGRDLASHGGKINATAEIDAAKAVPSIKAKLAADGVEFEQMFADAGLSPYLAGKADVEADFAAAGASQKAIVSSLGGRVKAAAQKGAVIGWDLGTSWRSIFDGLRRGLGLQPYNGGARTPVDVLTADIKIDDGVINATGAQARGPQFAAVAEGRARLLTQQAEYRGTFSTFVAPQLEVPFRAAGPWTSARPGVDPERGGWARVLLSLIGLGSGATLESVGGGGVDPELNELIREYAAKAEASGKLSGEDAEAIRKVRELLGPAR